MSVFFITGAGPHIGKTYATGYLGKQLMEQGVNVITQKLVQTGCDRDIATDIMIHRKIMQMPLQVVDKASESCPFVFPSLRHRLWPHSYKMSVFIPDDLPSQPNNYS
nr:dethiobiotin synthase [Psychrobacter sp. PraFG1]UNK06393.1 hypothetical protein MN210_07715 [Psychrobacter sp. PraFG1]